MKNWLTSKADVSSKRSTREKKGEEEVVGERDKKEGSVVGATKMSGKREPKGIMTDWRLLTICRSRFVWNNISYVLLSPAPPPFPVPPRKRQSETMALLLVTPTRSMYVRRTTICAQMPDTAKSQFGSERGLRPGERLHPHPLTRLMNIIWTRGRRKRDAKLKWNDDAAEY